MTTLRNGSRDTAAAEAIAGPGVQFHGNTLFERMVQ